jgi:peptidoglycan lytic transglycosylase
MNPRRALLLLATTCVLLNACAGRTPPVSKRTIAQGRAGTETGTASWYGPTFHGRITASGERYNMLDLTAAHRTYRFNTHVRVTNLVNGRRLIVRINDRGPFIRGRIIDLSYTAAKVLDIPQRGTCRVRLEVLDAEAGARALQRQLALVRRKGVKTWTDRDFAELAAAED